MGQHLTKVTDEEIPSFKLGISLAGAATGGCYSAGVMDFLIEAMNEWEAARLNDPTSVPGWRVEVTNLAGTSAGGLTASLSAASFNVNFEHFTAEGQSEPAHNALYGAWIKAMDYNSLLCNSDLEGPDDGKYVESLLNANFLRKCAETVLADHGEVSSLPEYSKNTVLSLTATNLRGVPYKVPNFVHAEDEKVESTMRRYADHTTFLLSDDVNSISNEIKEEAIPLDASQRDDTNWNHMITCSCATAAFPVGFPSVKVTTPASQYDARFRADPAWDGELNASNEFVYTAMDGGCVDNEPYGIVQEQLRRIYGKTLEDNVEAKDTWGSIWLIDPFPTVAPDNQAIQDAMPILPGLMKLITAIRGQAMFKPGGIIGETDVQSLTKMLIAPVRKNETEEQKYTLATGTLGSFGGMLDIEIRQHDYLLGRANCQDFLKNTFVMSRKDMKGNPIFSKFVTDGDGEEMIPIIPLIGTAGQNYAEPHWPHFNAAKRASITGAVGVEIKSRLDMVLKIFRQNSTLFQYAEDNGIEIGDLSGISALLSAYASLIINQELQVFA